MAFPDRAVFSEIRKIRLPCEGPFLAVQGVDAAALAAAITCHRENRDPARCLKRAAGRLVTRVPLHVQVPAGGTHCDTGGRDEEAIVEAVVKEVRLPWRWRICHVFRWPSRFTRDSVAARRLESHGVHVPRFLAASLYAPGGSAFLVTEHVSGCTTLRRILWQGSRPDGDSGRFADLLTRAGRWLWRLHQLGIWQRDMKPDNVLVQARDPSEWEFILLDTTDVRFRKGPLDASRRVRNLGQILDLPARVQDFARGVLLQAYATAGDSQDGSVDPAHRGRPTARSWEALVREDIEARRAERRRALGVTYVDEAPCYREESGRE